MATWTNIADTFLEPGKPVRSVDGLALRDNPIAIAEGSPGAPKIQNAAMDNNSVDNANVVNGALGSEKFQTGEAERNWVLARTAAASLGAVGTYGLFAVITTSNSVTEGQTTAGSNLRYASAGDSEGGTPSGTWRAMGRASVAVGGSGNRTTVFLRIS